jgi:hypothetical protein
VGTEIAQGNLELAVAALDGDLDSYEGVERDGDVGGHIGGGVSLGWLGDV